MTERAKLTIVDVARLAGVSRSTVSRVVNGKDDVRPEVRTRVLQVIDETGFRPNASARSLVSSRTGVIGMVIPWRVHALLDDPYFVRLIHGVSRASNAAGTTLSLFIFETEEQEAELYGRVVAPRLVDGLILAAIRNDDPLLDRVINSGLPVVSCGRVSHRDDFTWVDIDNFTGSRIAAQHLAGLGHRRIALISPPQDAMAGIHRHDGFADGLREAGIELPDELVAFADWSEESGYQAMRQLMPHRPTGLYAASDTMAVGALRALREAGWKVPDDLAVVSFDGLSVSERTVPPLTTVRQPVIEVGEALMRMLLDQIESDGREPAHLMLPTELVIRDSCGARKGDQAPA